MEQMKEQVSPEVHKFVRRNTRAARMNQLWLDVNKIIEGAMHL